MRLIQTILISAGLVLIILCVLSISTAANTKLQVEYWVQDRLNSHKPKTLLVGSSTITRFSSNMAMSCGDSVNRGFENGLASNVKSYLDYANYLELENIVVYIGENDLFYGATTDTVLSDAGSLLEFLQENAPGRKIAFMSVKPSPARMRFHVVFSNFNRRLSQLVSEFNNASIIPLHSIRMPDYYMDDGVHLNENGYRLLASYVNQFCEQGS